MSPLRRMPLSAGELTSRFVLQSLSEVVSGSTIVPTWTTIDTVFARKMLTGVEAARLPSEESAPRRRFDVVIRRRPTPLLLPLRLLDAQHGNAVAFALDIWDDDSLRDQTLISCVDGINMSVGSGESVRAAEGVTVYRGTDTIQADKSTKRTWAIASADVPVLIEDADEQLLLRLFGLEVQAELRGTVDIGADVRLGDGVLVTDGRHAGQRFLVAARRIDPALPAQAYWALALKRTTEPFS